MSSSRLIDRIFGKWSSVPSPASFYLFSESELRDCQDYFSKVQSDPTVPPNELIMAAERLTLLRSEVDVRHGDANYRRAQRLAWSAIGLAMISLATQLVLELHKFSQSSQAATIGLSIWKRRSCPQQWPLRCQRQSRKLPSPRIQHQT